MSYRELVPEWISNIPVVAVAGLIRGCRWTLAPFSSYWRGNYESEIQQALLARNEWTGKSVWDIGAHFGFYTVGLARLVGPTGQVTAFEPMPDAYRKLQRHVLLNGWAHVQTLNVAASEARSRLPLILDGERWSAASHAPYLGESLPGEESVARVQAVAIDDLMSEGSVRPAAFVKIDVEGHAGSVLRGARQAIAGSLPEFLISFHSPDEIAGVIEVLRPLRYAGKNLQGTTVHLDEIRVGDQLFLNSAN